MAVTTDEARTCTGIDWVMVVSPRSSGGKLLVELVMNDVSLFALLLASTSREFCGPLVVVVVVVVIGAETRDEKRLVVMVRTRRGILSCLVRRIEADEPVRAERRARVRRTSGTWRLMAFRAEAD